MYGGRTWKEKLADSKNLPRVEKLAGPHRERYGAGTMVIPAPKEVDAVMKLVPKGQLITINEIRAVLAKKHRATMGCPITTGIFAWIAAQAADEAAEAGQKRITPYWRTLKSGGELNAKYPGGIKRLKKLLQEEGHSVKLKGKKYVVEDFEEKLAEVTLK